MHYVYVVSGSTANARPKSFYQGPLLSFLLRSQLNRREEKDEDGGEGVNGHGGGENGLGNGNDDDGVTVERGHAFSASSSSSGRSSRPSSFRP